MRGCGLVATPLIAVLMALLVSAASVAAAGDGPVVTITVVGPDGEAVSGAKVVLYDTDGNRYESTTDENGVATISVPANGTYLVVVKSEYYILDTVDVAGDVSKTVNASAMHHVNITSTPLSVDTTVLLTAFNYTELTMTTNVTVYAPSSISITFPEEVVKFPYRYVFDRVEYDGVETSETTVTVDMARDYTVAAYYTKTFYMTLEYWMVIALVVVIVAALAIAWSAARAAKAMISEWRSRSRRFVKKR